MPRLLVIDDRDQTVEMCHRQLPQFDTVTRCERRIPCQVCEERDRGCPLKCAHDYFEAAEVLARAPALPDLAILDLHFAVPEGRLLPEDKSALPVEAKARKAALEKLRRTQGLLILERLRRDFPSLPVVMLTTTGAELGADRPADPLVYFSENDVVDSRSLAAEITRALALGESQKDGSVFWGRSAAMAELRRSIGVLARSPLPVLIEGETGTGKSFLAEHAIHPRSGAKGPLVVTDLSTVPTALLPAHLFGARRGAYTGAVEDHPGVFEQAHGGTLFLDEIANLDLDLQRQLLLALERGQVTRLGDTRPRPAAPKLVAATNQDLAALVRQGRFRSDLYMRLNPGTRLHVPSLRDRKEDIADLVRFCLLEALRSDGLRPLVRQYLARFPTPDDCREDNHLVIFGRPAAREARRDAMTVFLSKAALGRLEAHDWPGNVRELRLFAINALVHALVAHLDVATTPPPASAKAPPPSVRAPAILALSDALVDRLLAPDRSRPSGRARSPRAGDRGRRIDVEIPTGTTFAGISAEVERQYLRAVYHACDGDLAKMAVELLGPKGAARQVHLRLNQLGLKLRELRAAGASSED
ncbi:MAG TPA: sigma 54-interacting transcriptional regulator [Polyangia bacterium]|jgi:two-component system nitrogen regulation response regulator GlnG